MNVIVCDRCGLRMGTDPGMGLAVEDTVRGLRGNYDLCGPCAGEFAYFLRPDPGELAAQDRRRAANMAAIAMMDLSGQRVPDIQTGGLLNPVQP